MAEETREDLAEVLRRAEEIKDQTGLLLEHDPETRSYILAAEEAGIPRDATIQALRERLIVPIQSFKDGAYVFAASEDGHFYVAIYEGMEYGKAKVKFVSGADHVADLRDLRMFSLTPGRSIDFHYPDLGMWCEGKVQAYDADKKKVRVTYWGIEDTWLPLTKIRLRKEKKPGSVSDKARLWAIGVGAGVGGSVLGALLTWLLTR